MGPATRVSGPPLRVTPQRRATVCTGTPEPGTVTTPRGVGGATGGSTTLVSTPPSLSTLCHWSLCVCDGYHRVYVSTRTCVRVLGGRDIGPHLCVCVKSGGKVQGEDPAGTAGGILLPDNTFRSGTPPVPDDNGTLPQPTLRARTTDDDKRLSFTPHHACRASPSPRNDIP